MIERLYVNNFRCFESFTLDLVSRPSALVIGKNGAGKSTLRQALGIFQKICRGPNRVKLWIEGSDFTQQRRNSPMRFETDLVLTGKRFKYTIAFDFPENFREARVFEESCVVEGNTVFSRQLNQVTLPNGSTFGLDWHVAALPVIEERRGETSLRKLNSFFASMILIAPVPKNMEGFTEEESLELEEDAANLSAWYNSLLLSYPEAYAVLFAYLKELMPDLGSLRNVSRGEKGKQLLVNFEAREAGQNLSIEFKKLSDGEKCFFLSALIVASNKFRDPVFCMWDEPDNHLSLPEIGHFITALRRLTNEGGQFIATSHHPETIRKFSDENTLVFTRRSHLEPTVVRPLTDISYTGDLIGALIREEVIG